MHTPSSPAEKNVNALSESAVLALSRLARINLTEEEAGVLTADLQKILDYVEALKQVNTDSLPEVAQVTGLKNGVRADEPMPSSPKEREAILKNAPAIAGEYFKVKEVFKD